MLKALETPEQKRARRMAKKQEKLRRQRQKEGWNEDYLVSLKQSQCLNLLYHFFDRFSCP